MVIALSASYDPKHQDLLLSRFLFHVKAGAQTIEQVTVWLHFPPGSLKECSISLLMFVPNSSLFISFIPIYSMRSHEIRSTFVSRPHGYLWILQRYSVSSLSMSFIHEVGRPGFAVILAIFTFIGSFFVFLRYRPPCFRLLFPFISHGISKFH